MPKPPEGVTQIPEDMPPLPKDLLKIPKEGKLKNLLPKIIFGVILIAALAFGGYFYLQNQLLKNEIAQLQETPSPTPEATAIPSPTNEPTAGWKTYENTAYGYSISFPSTWKAFSIAAGSGATDALPESLIVDISDTNQTSRPYPNGVITIQGFDAMPSYDSTWTKSLTNINGAAVTIYDKTDAQDGPSVAYIIQGSPGAKYIEVLFRSSKQDSIYKTFSVIISTFKFTN